VQRASWASVSPRERAAHVPWLSQFPEAQSTWARQAVPAGRLCEGGDAAQVPDAPPLVGTPALVKHCPDAHVRGYMQTPPAGVNAVQMLAAAGSDENEQ